MPVNLSMSLWRFIFVLKGNLVIWSISTCIDLEDLSIIAWSDRYLDLLVAFASGICCPLNLPIKTDFFLYFFYINLVATLVPIATNLNHQKA